MHPAVDLVLQLLMILITGLLYHDVRVASADGNHLQHNMSLMPDFR